MSALAVVTRPADQDTDDLDLVARVRTGDDRAFELLYRRHQPRIAARVRAMVRDAGRAEDITQEVFIAALRRMRETDRPIAFKPWIHEIAKNACIDAFRRSRGREEVSFDAHALRADGVGRLAEPGATPDSVVEGKVALDNLRGAFGGLSSVHHEILVLREFEGMSYRDIGERLGLSRPAVESTLFRARRRLSEEYEQLVSGERCRRVQRIVDAEGAAAAGLRDRRRLARHLAHCQPCRRHAGLAGVDVDAVATRPGVAGAVAAKAARIAAFAPLPWLLRRRAGGAEQAGHVLGRQSAAPVAQWTANVAGALDPALVAGWTKAVATAAAVTIAGVGAGAAISGRDPLNRLIAHVPAAAAGRWAGPGSGAAARPGSAAQAGRPQARGALMLRGPLASAATGGAFARLEPAGGRVRAGAGRIASGGGPGWIATSSRGDGLARPAAPPVGAGPVPIRPAGATTDALAPRGSVTAATGAASGAAPGGRGTPGVPARGDERRAVRRLIERLRGAGAGAGDGSGGGDGSGAAGAAAAGAGVEGASAAGPASSATAAIQGLPAAVSVPIAPAPAASPAVESASVPTASPVGDTVRGVSAVLTSTLTPAPPPS